MTLITEQSIRPADLMSQKRACVIADRNYLLERRDQWVEVSCPACQETSFEAYGDKDDIAYVSCNACGTIYTNPRPNLTLLHEFYSQSENYAFWNEHIFPATETARRERIFKPRAARLDQLCNKFEIQGGTFLEIGAAFGTFCQEVDRLQRFKQVVGVEPTPGLAATCRQRGIETRECFVEQIEGQGFARTISAFEVIEHLFAPQDFITTCERLLEPGGLLILSCPNAQGFDVATLGLQSGTFDHEHLNYFNPSSLSNLVEACGLEVLEVQTPGQLDVDLVRNAVQQGRCDLSHQPFLQSVIVDRFEELGKSFQEYLSDHCMSSHLWIVARKR